MIRVRRLQRRNDDGEWYDDAYVLETGQGVRRFCYNLTWDRVGARLNGQLKEKDIELEAIETLLPSNKGLRWLPVEEVEDAHSEAFLEELDERCAIPKPRSVRDKVNKTIAA